MESQDRPPGEREPRTRLGAAYLLHSALFLSSMTLFFSHSSFGDTTVDGLSRTFSDMRSFVQRQLEEGQILEQLKNGVCVDGKVNPDFDGIAFGATVDVAKFLKIPSLIGASATWTLEMTIMRQETPSGVRLVYDEWIAPAMGWEIPSFNRNHPVEKKLLDVGDVYLGSIFGCGRDPNLYTGFFLTGSPPGFLLFSLGFDMEALAFNHSVSKEESNTPQGLDDYERLDSEGHRDAALAVETLAGTRFVKGYDAAKEEWDSFSFGGPKNSEEVYLGTDLPLSSVPGTDGFRDTSSAFLHLIERQKRFEVQGKSFPQRLADLVSEMKESQKLGGEAQSRAWITLLVGRFYHDAMQEIHELHRAVYPLLEYDKSHNLTQLNYVWETSVASLAHPFSLDTLSLSHRETQEQIGRIQQEICPKHRFAAVSWLNRAGLEKKNLPGIWDCRLARIYVPGINVPQGSVEELMKRLNALKRLARASQKKMFAAQGFIQILNNTYAQFLQRQPVDPSVLKIGGVARSQVWGCNTVSFSLKGAVRVLRAVKEAVGGIGADIRTAAAQIKSFASVNGSASALGGLGISGLGRVFKAGLGMSDTVNVNVSYMYRVGDFIPGAQLGHGVDTLPKPLRRFLENPCQ